METNEMYERLLEQLGADVFLNALYQAMDTDTCRENFEFIAREYDIDLE